jgi:putative pyrroloquinoline-quinone-binding quinoprotein
MNAIRIRGWRVQRTPAVLSMVLMAACGVACGSTSGGGAAAGGANAGSSGGGGRASISGSGGTNVVGASGGHGTSTGTGAPASGGGGTSAPAPDGGGEADGPVGGSSTTGSGGSNPGTGGSSGVTAFAVTTDRYDNARSGVDLQETQLTTSNVNASHFGLLFTRSVDGQIYGQPLYVGGLTMADKKVHNVVYVTTENNTVYAFDADQASASSPLWSLALGHASASDPACDNLAPKVGITSTPVIDPAAGIIYFISKGLEGSWVQRIHAVDIVTGAERPGSPQVLSASVKGTGAGSSNGNVAFDPRTQLNRPGLLLVNGVVYAAFASHCDEANYHGWILGYSYDGTKFTQALAFNVSPNGSKGGIWQGGVGLSSDGTSIFVVAGNGSTNTNGSDLSESVFRLRLSDYSVQDYWIPAAYNSLNAADADLSSGAILMPHSLLMTGSKDGRLYVLDSTNLGKYNGTDRILQTLTTPGKASGAQGHVHGGPVYYEMPSGGGEKVFVWPEDSPLMSYTLNSTTRTLGNLVSDPIRSSGFTPGHPGAILTLSANGSVPGSAIVWATMPTANGTNGAWHVTSAGAIYAVDASNLTNVLWGDGSGTWNVAKFAPPAVANGHVYVGTFSNELRVYGLTN